MTALEIKIIAYGLLALLIIGGSGYAGYDIAEHHYQRLMASEQAREQTAVIVQQQQNAITIAKWQAASAASEKQIEDLKASAVTLGGELSTSLREYTALHSRLVSATANAPSGTSTDTAGAQSDSGLTELAGQAATACEADAAELIALQSWAKALSR